MTAIEKKKYTADQLVEMIRCKFSGNAYAVLEQVADGTGAGATSWIDAAVFSLWPSNGVWRAACEVKVSRADFLKELASPEKNRWAREHFDYFWYVCAPGIAKDDEVPMGCGLMNVRGNGLSIAKQAPLREGVITDKWIIASFARSLEKYRQNFVHNELRLALESSYDYRRAKYWQDGGERYVKACGSHCYPESADEVLDKLTEIARGKSPDGNDATHALEVLEHFNGKVVDFLLAVAPLAAHVLNARDEAGDYFVKRWGGEDAAAIEQLRATAKKRKRGYGREKETASKTLAVREVLTEFANAEPTP